MAISIPALRGSGLSWPHDPPYLMGPTRLCGSTGLLLWSPTTMQGLTGYQRTSPVFQPLSQEALTSERPRGLTLAI